MQSSRFHAITARLSGMNLRTSFSRRSASSPSSTTSSAVQSPSSSRAPSANRALVPVGQRRSYASSNGMSFSSVDSSGGSAVSSPVSVSINSIVFRRPSVLDLEEERRSYGPELVGLLEPRPIVLCSVSLDERVGSLY